MKISYISAMALSIILLCSCDGGGKDEPNPAPTPGKDDVTVTISTEVLTKANVTTVLGSGDEMNVYPKSYGRIDAPNRVDGVKATCNGSAWTMSPAVTLSKGENAFIYAVAPYNASYSDAAAIPVKMSDQVDLLYSGAFVPVSFTTYNAKLVMKHALSLVTVNITSQGYSGAGQLNSMSISGEEVFTAGTMNAGTGKIVGTDKTPYVHNVNKQIKTEGWSQDLPRMWQIPFSTKVNAAILTLVIDGKTYEVEFPEVEMRTGFQYIFRLVLTDYGVEFIPGEMQTISLNQKEDAMNALSAYGVITFTHVGEQAFMPMFSGDNVFGTITWGDGTAQSYKANAEHTFTGSASRQIVIESWNSTGFELNELTGIETIDLTEY